MENNNVVYDERFISKNKGVLDLANLDYNELIKKTSDQKYIDLDYLLDYLELSCEESDILEAGYLDRDKHKIVVKKTDCPERKRFTIAHEIGHYVLHSDENNYRNGSYEECDMAKETAANYYAADLLMPRSLVIDAIKFGINKLKLSKENALYDYQEESVIEYAANYINVSKQSFDYRLMNIGVSVYDILHGYE